MGQDLREQGDCHREASAIDWAARARRLAPAIEAAAPRGEQDRQVPDEIISAMHDAELFRAVLPRWCGGGECTAMDVMRLSETIAAADASTAWCLGQALGCTLAAAFIDREAAQDIFGEPDAVLAWGPPSPGAKAVAENGGYGVTGAWRFASGSRHATWLGAHCPIFEADGAPRLGDDGKPVVRTVMFPKASAKMTDVWQVIGLKGTGSDNYAVEGIFVPETYTYVRDSAADRRESAPIYRVPLLTFYGISFSGVALGIARATLDSFIELASEKVGSGATDVLRKNAVNQMRVAQSEAQLRSSRAFLAETVEEYWQKMVAAERPSLDLRARLRLAITYAMNQAREVVNFAYQAAGTNAIFEANPFERRFRDMHTVSQQGQAHVLNFEFAGQVFLGLPPSGHRV